MERVEIRSMSAEDIGEVMRIENSCFTTPWNEPSFRYELENRDAILKVAVAERKVVGYVCLRTMLDVTHVLNLAVLPEFRRRGIGSRLLGTAMKELAGKKPDVTSVTLEVRESNSAAIGLYEKYGFYVSGRRTGYYRKPVENAVIMKMDGGGKKP